MHARSDGFVLTELLVAGLIAAFLVLGLMQMAAATSRGLALIESLSEVQQGARFAADQMREVIMATGYHPAPWESGAALAGLSPDSADGGAGESDVLKVRQFSDRNCYGTFNPVLDGAGRPEFYLRESTFERSASGNLAHTCLYGPSSAAMVRQINREGLVRRLESFQVLYAVDTDGDRRADRTVRAGNWDDIAAVQGVQLGLLLATEKPAGVTRAAPLKVLDEVVVPRADGRLRRVWTAVVPFASKLR